MSAISSAVVGLATLVLAVFTWLLWTETRHARRPSVQVVLDLIAPRYGEIRLVNAGAGPALNVDVAITSSPGGATRRWRRSVLLGGEGHNVHLVVSQSGPGDIERVIAEYPAVEVSGSYSDIAGKVYRVDEKLDVAADWEAAKTAGQLAAFRGPLLPLHDEVRRLATAIEQLARNRPV